MADVFHYDVFVREFELQLRYNVHIQNNALEKGMNTFTLLPAPLDEIAPLLLPDGFTIKLPIKQRNQTKYCKSVSFF